MFIMPPHFLLVERVITEELRLVILLVNSVSTVETINES